MGVEAPACDELLTVSIRNPHFGELRGPRPSPGSSSSSRRTCPPRTCRTNSRDPPPRNGQSRALTGNARRRCAAERSGPSQKQRPGAGTRKKRGLRARARPATAWSARRQEWRTRRGCDSAMRQRCHGRRRSGPWPRLRHTDRIRRRMHQAASITARCPASFACEERTSNFWAMVILGTAVVSMSCTFAFVAASTISLPVGRRRPTQPTTVLPPNLGSSSDGGGLIEKNSLPCGGRALTPQHTETPRAAQWILLGRAAVATNYSTMLENDPGNTILETDAPKSFQYSSNLLCTDIWGH